MRDEWLELIEEYPQVAFNYKSFQGILNDRAHGFKHIYIAEPETMWPAQWDPEVLEQYDTVITYNPTFYNQWKSRLNLRLVQGVLACNFSRNNITDDELVPYKKKLDRCCILNRYYELPGPPEGFIKWLLPEIATKMDADVWSPQAWGFKERFCGTVPSPYHHSHVNQLKKIAEYRYCICFESTYHETMSMGFITERLANCLKAGTIPIYYGCYNIKDYVPTELFIDFRKYYNPKINETYIALKEYLQSITEDEYNDCVRAGREWVKTCRLGSTEDLRTLLSTLV